MIITVTDHEIKTKLKIQGKKKQYTITKSLLFRVFEALTNLKKGKYKPNCFHLL